MNEDPAKPFAVEEVSAVAAPPRARVDDTPDTSGDASGETAADPAANVTGSGGAAPPMVPAKPAPPC